MFTATLIAHRHSASSSLSCILATVKLSRSESDLSLNAVKAASSSLLAACGLALTFYLQVTDPQGTVVAQATRKQADDLFFWHPDAGDFKICFYNLAHGQATVSFEVSEYYQYQNKKEGDKVVVKTGELRPPLVVWSARIIRIGRNGMKWSQEGCGSHEFHLELPRLCLCGFQGWL